MKKRILSLVQLAIGIGLIVFIFVGMKDKGDLLEAFRAGARHWPLMAVGLGGFGICLLCCILRWKLLLDARGMVLPLRRVTALYFVGHFFNSFLFGATGGDVVKAWFVTREMPEKKTEAVSTIALDRIIGVLALILLTVVMMCLRLPFYLSLPETRLAMVFNTALLLAAIAFLVVAFGRNWLEHWSWFKRLEERTVLGKIVMRAYTTCHSCLNEPALLVKTFLLSLTNHVVLVGCAWFLGRGLEIGLSFWDYLTVFPVINAVAAVPLTPGGLGTRETAAKLLLGAMGVAATRAVPLSLLVYGSMLLWSLVGGVVYLFYVSGREKPRPV